MLVVALVHCVLCLTFFFIPLFYSFFTLLCEYFCFFNETYILLIISSFTTEYYLYGKSWVHPLSHSPLSNFLYIGAFIDVWSYIKKAVLVPVKTLVHILCATASRHAMLLHYRLLCPIYDWHLGLSLTFSSCSLSRPWTVRRVSCQLGQVWEGAESQAGAHQISVAFPLNIECRLVNMP